MNAMYSCFKTSAVSKKHTCTYVDNVHKGKC